MDYSEWLSSGIKKKFNELLVEDELPKHKNIERCTVPIMTRYVEDYIAMLVDKVNQNKKLYLYIDIPLSVDPKPSYKRNPIKRADIIVYSRDGDVNTIKMIIEIKSQLGYCRHYITDKENGKEDYDKRIAQLERKNVIIKYNKKDMDTGKKNVIYFKLDDNCKKGVVALMNTNINDSDFDAFINNENYYCLFDKNNFDDKDFWYDKLSSNNKYKDEKHGFDAFIKFITL